MVELVNRLTIRGYPYHKTDERGFSPRVHLSDRESQIQDLLMASLRWIVRCIDLKIAPSDAAKELEKLATFAQGLAAESGSELPPNIGTITDDLRELADDVDLLGPKAASVDLRAGYVSCALAVIYSDVVCDVEAVAKSHTKSRCKSSPTVSELTTKDVVSKAMCLLDDIRKTPVDDRAHCAQRLPAFADRLNKCPEVTAYQDAGSSNPDQKPNGPGQPGGRKQKITLEEANIEVRRLLKENPSSDWTVRTLAQKVGCSIGTISTCPMWHAYKERRDKLRTEGTINTVSLTKELEAVLGTGEKDEQLHNVIAEQEKDRREDARRARLYRSHEKKPKKRES
jgi:hypothetical protein